jgi:hypothetical protein
MAKHLAVLLTEAQALQLIEAGKRWWTVKSMTDGPGRDMHAAQATRNGVEALERAVRDAQR